MNAKSEREGTVEINEDRMGEGKQHSMFARCFQRELISYGTIFFSYDRLAPVGLISPETNQRTD